MNINYYQNKINSNNAIINKLKKVLRIMPFLNLFFFLIFATLLYVAFRVPQNEEYYFILSALFFSLFIYSHRRDAKFRSEYDFYLDI